MEEKKLIKETVEKILSAENRSSIREIILDALAESDSDKEIFEDKLVTKLEVIQESQDNSITLLNIENALRILNK